MATDIVLLANSNAAVKNGSVIVNVMPNGTKGASNTYNTQATLTSIDDVYNKLNTRLDDRVYYG